MRFTVCNCTCGLTVVIAHVIINTFTGICILIIFSSLSSPGSRWIRLLFGREFHLPSVLQLWDALFVEGPSLGLMDYVFVTMLTLIRDTRKYMHV